MGDDRILTMFDPVRAVKGVLKGRPFDNLPQPRGGPSDTLEDLVKGRPFATRINQIKDGVKSLGLSPSTPDAPVLPPELPPPEPLPPVQTDSESVREAVRGARRPRGVRRQTTFNVGGGRGIPRISPLTPQGGGRATLGA